MEEKPLIYYGVYIYDPDLENSYIYKKKKRSTSLNKGYFMSRLTLAVEL